MMDRLLWSLNAAAKRRTARDLRRASFLLCLMLGITLPGVSYREEADFIIFNARVHTVDPTSPRAEAFAVHGERFVAVGSNRDVLQQYPHARRLDAGGLTIVPGFIDAHAHLQGLGLNLIQADLVGTRSVAEVVARLEAFAADLPAGAWLIGRGWDQNYWPGAEFPTRHALDEAFPDRPVWLRRIDGHAGWANSAALKAARLTDDVSAPPGGRIVASEQGDPTGILIDAAMALVDDVVPPLEEAVFERALLEASSAVHRAGITGVHDAGSDLATIQRYRKAIDAATLDLRVYAMTDAAGDAFEHFCSAGPLVGYRDRLSVRSAKFYVDGALGSRGAALLEDYADDPGNTGLLQYEPEDLMDMVRRAADCSFQVAIHAIGDRGNRIALDVYESGLSPEERASGRHRIEHAQVIHIEDLPRFGRLNVIASVQPTHATSDMPWAEIRLGHERISGAYAWRSLIDTGARLALGSDFPVEEVSPILGIYAAVARRDVAGLPSEGWNTEQALTREEALRGFTLDAAYAAFMESEIGSIEARKLADFVVLSSDLFDVPQEQIKEIEIVATFVGGRCVSGGW